MAKSSRRRKSAVRFRVGRVSYYEHHGGWWVYYRDGNRPVRRRVADTADEAERIAAQINNQLCSGSPTLLAFRPVAVAELRDEFLAHHENVLRSSVSTIRRYRAATQHLLDYVAQLGRELPAHELSAEAFAAFLRTREVAPNGHPHSARRRLRDKGVQYILEVCRSLYAYAQRTRRLPPYADNPFSVLPLDRMRIEDAKPVFVFTEDAELAFWQAVSDWAFPLHFTLAKTGLRPGELTHLLIEDLDLDAGWLHVRNKKELGWRIKTGTERAVPLVPELRELLRRTIADRTAGPVFLRPRFLSGPKPLLNRDRRAMAEMLSKRLAEETERQGQELTREQRLRVARGVWRDVGALKVDRLRSSFVATTRKLGWSHATCTKSWRHTFATLLQDANVDPLIRQLTLGHKASGTQGALGMTSVYTHTRLETQQQEIDRALRLWPRSLEWAAQGNVS